MLFLDDVWMSSRAGNRRVGRREPDRRAGRHQVDEGDAVEQDLEGPAHLQDVHEAVPLHFRREQGARGGRDDRPRPQHQDRPRGKFFPLYINPLILPVLSSRIRVTLFIGEITSLNYGLVRSALTFIRVIFDPGRGGSW
jgi:hypothetical protein